MRILLAEDDGRIGQALQGAFEVHGDAIDWVKDGKQAHHAIATNNYEVLLLDVNMPYEDGLSLISVARRQAYAKDLSIIIITANDNVKERVQALDLGADDYLVKRRQLGYQCNQLSNDVLTLDLDSRQVQYQGEWKYLSNREYAVLYALMSHAGAVQSRQALEEKIYSWDSEIESNVIEFIIHSLRKKLGSDVIKNIRGLGWFVDKKS